MMVVIVMMMVMMMRVDIGVLTYQESAHGDDGLLQLEYFFVFFDIN